MKNFLSSIKRFVMSFIYKCTNLFHVKNTSSASSQQKAHFLAKFFSNKLKNFLNANIDTGLHNFYRGNILEAKLYFKLMNILFPCSAVIKYNIARCYFALGNTNMAYNYFIKTLRLDKNCNEALYYIKKIKNPISIKFIPNNLIRQYFNNTGGYFVEHWLISKQYRGHEYVYIGVVSIFNNDHLSDLKILDLGCGTGVCGHFLKINCIGSYAVGIDISSRMLNVARGCFVNNKPVYNELINISLREFLGRKKCEQYDVIIFSEVLHYVYDFEYELRLSRNFLSNKGAVICLVRRKKDKGKNKGVDFINKGDYFCHSEHYIRCVAEKISMEISYMSYCKIYGSQVDGILFILQFKKSELKAKE
ncbi:methyltransferase [Wolbachia endosymbiont of Pentidionis agamae]|uniref:methyltransferase n=1 Tax=Wolbachia endosymbiont of Pentidionis agamae TaxID=3110435 RepID=UPI0038CD101F